MVCDAQKQTNNCCNAVGLDITDEFVVPGKAVWKEAGVDQKIELRIGNAQETIQALAAEEGQAGSYDLAFIDADKVGYDVYYEASMKLVRQVQEIQQLTRVTSPGSLVLAQPFW